MFRYARLALCVTQHDKCIIRRYVLSTRQGTLCNSNLSVSNDASPFFLAIETELIISFGESIGISQELSVAYRS